MAVASRAVGLEVPGSGGRLEFSGYVDGLAVVGGNGGPRQRPQGLLSLSFDGKTSGVLRGHLQLRTRLGGPFEGGHPGVYNLVHVFQNRSPALEVREGYIDVLLEHLDVRVGVQAIAWGKLDGIPPTDLLNPRDYHDPIIADSEERKIGVPAIVGNYYLPDQERLGLTHLRATLLWIPVAVPPRLALLEERWFPPAIVPGSRVTLSRGLVARALEPSLPPGVRVEGSIEIPIEVSTQNQRPPKSLRSGGIGFRLGGTWREHDWDIYHYTGPESVPDLDLIASVRLEDFDLDGGVARLRLRGRSTLRQAHDTLHMTGADWSMVLGAATLRAEAALFVNRPYLRLSGDMFSQEALRQLPLRRIVRRLLGPAGRANVPLGDLFPDQDAVEWGVGADYNVNGFQPLLQVNQVIVLDSAPRLLVDDPETRFIGSLRKRFFDERIEVDLRGFYAIERGGWYVLPRLVYRPRDDVRLRLGYLAIGGSRSSVVGQFGENDEVIFEARWVF